MLDVQSTMGHDLPHSLLMYAFAAHLSGPGVLVATPGPGPAVRNPHESRHARRPSTPTYAHNDPAGAYPDNIFFDHLVPFLKNVAAG